MARFEIQRSAALALLALASSLLACSIRPVGIGNAADAGEDASAAPADAPADAGPDPGADASDAASRSDACVAQDRAVATHLDGVRNGRNVDTILEVIDGACGASFYASGPTALDAHRLVRIGSNTKTYVAVVILDLVADGKLTLDERIDAHLPTVPSVFAPITVRQLMQHTGGVYNYTNSTSFVDTITSDPKHHWAPADLVALAAAQPLDFKPGTSWSYSNTDYILLGMLAEAVGGAPIASLIRQRVLSPNHLDETFFDGEETVTGEMAPGLDKQGRDVTTIFDPSWAWTAGAMVASPPDLARFFQLVATGALLTPAMQSEMLKTVATTQDGLKYGLGIFYAEPSITGGAGPAIGHGGDIAGYHSSTFYFTDKSTSVVGVADTDSIAGNDVMVAALEALFP